MQDEEHFEAATSPNQPRLLFFLIEAKKAERKGDEKKLTERENDTDRKSE